MPDTKERKSCIQCIHFEMCKWKGEPYMGSHSEGFPARDYNQYYFKWYILHGSNCSRFLEKKE